MRVLTTKFGLALVGFGLLTACSDNGQPKLMNIRSDTPDEFSIMPNKPLEQPEDYEALPEPTPGGRNRADVVPEEDAVAALGGNPDALRSDRTNAGEGALLAQARRYGTNSNIREVLAEEDLEYRRENNGRLLERLFNVNVYFDSYQQQSLDQHRELDRLRDRGVATPSAPPDPERF
ncbi:DUF3035 domain-containing protein [Maritimibacter sp. UBA3975]|uniref:DUF3035 domain-containing protein n=1 Tax=Maritimibacter sp. UBA3975 TaxID=1946833 RepID=UPI000C0AD293|nr:DUF3035 domain-containing protein [Maritimibacter sp. UBA3975]MAM63622.1 pyruvate/2-oxoglutarate dehydrogenase complex, dihydrolipoamide acyltransferase (E2) component [Maritimibacter sp.]|tara:strand:- start:27633 stop:28163 length:531 start_codon:yes stop_codon:yes gene_type:complete